MNVTEVDKLPTFLLINRPFQINPTIVKIFKRKYYVTENNIETGE